MQSKNQHCLSILCLACQIITFLLLLFNQIIVLEFHDGNDLVDWASCLALNATFLGVVFSLMSLGGQFLSVPGDKGSSKSLAARCNGSLAMIKSCCFLLCRKSFQISLTPGQSTVTNRHNCTAQALCKQVLQGKHQHRLCLVFHGV